MIKKILLGLLTAVIVAVISGYFYFSAGSETYPEVLSQGRAAPDFTGQDQHGQQLQLSELIRKGPVVLIFYRGLWCPSCQKHLGELQASLDQFVKKGATVVAITPERPESTRQNIPVNSTSISIVHDKDYEILNAFQVAYQLSKGTQRLYGAMGIDLEAANGNDQNTLPIPAMYVIGTDGKIKFAYEKAGGLVPEYLPASEILEQISD